MQTTVAELGIRGRPAATLAATNAQRPRRVQPKSALPSTSKLALGSVSLLALAALGLSIVVQTGCGNAMTDVGIGEDDVNGCHGYGYGYAKKCGPYGGNGP